MRFRVLILLLITTTLQGLGSAQTPNPRFSLNISAAKSNVKAGAEVRIQIIQKNMTDQDQPFWIDKHYRENGEYLFLTDALQEDGKKAHRSEYFRGLSDENGQFNAGVATSGMLINKKPGEIISSSIDLNALYELRPGKYTVQVNQNDSIAKLTVKSNTITLTVTP